MYFKASGGFLLYSAYFAFMESLTFVSKHIPEFAGKLKGIEVSTLPISAYSKRYLKYLLTHSIYYLTIYSVVLESLLQHIGKAPEQISLVDYGAGNGLLGIFAKFCGFKKVYLCDMNSDFIHASGILANQLNIDVDDFIVGDINSIAISSDRSSIDAVVGTDVIEHIYNLDGFFSTIQKINPEMITVFTTASNPDNFIRTRQLKKLQIKDEYQGSDPKDFILAGAEKQEPFILIREKIIRENFPQLQKNDITVLAKATRGLNKADILTAISLYLQTGEKPMPDETSVNTCDPLTGSWTEHILSIQEYESIYARYGYSLEIKNGFYDDTTPGIKKYLKKGLNILTNFTGRNTAPFIILTGYKPC